MSPALHAFAGYGVELEYMIVDARSMDVLPVADRVLRGMAGRQVADYADGEIGLSNELVLHLIELKNLRPRYALDLKALAASFQAEAGLLNRLLQPLDGQLMPTAMHPWMNPRTETRLWPHRYAAIYRAYDRIFDCRRHGWANLQSMHLNLPFANDQEFARLHAAARLVLPILPALAASSPYAEGKASGYLDCRMENYRTHQARVPSSAASVVPETIATPAEYETRILQPLYRDIAPYDPDGLLRREWLNVRGAVPRFARSAIEIRVVDMQECPLADCAIAAAVINLVGMLYEGQYACLPAQQQIATEELAAIMQACIRDADDAVIDHAGYLGLLGLAAGRCTARDVWRRILANLRWEHAAPCAEWRTALDLILEQGPLARRILRAAGAAPRRAALAEVYRELCDCLAQGRMFHA